MEKESKWSQKYKNSIDCSNPKGFSQRAHCQGLKKKKKSKASILDSLNRIAIILEDNRKFLSASEINDVFLKLANKFKPEYQVPFPMNLDDALNNYDSDNYEVDVEGDWEDTETVSDFREEASDDLLHSPATVDDNHLIFYNEDEDHVEVMNMVPKHHLDTLHKNPSKQTKFIKRAED
jgi:hypothetical protein